ncbi:hypothetical protein [Providencia sp. Me31A]|uniref:hypothetical protein n=1 Tax=Providencia sp. Me31A TaxID=3392637 RepID=UPI003D2B2505
MGHTIEYMIMQRKKNMFGGIEYKHEEIDKRYRAWGAATSYIRGKLNIQKTNARG